VTRDLTNSAYWRVFGEELMGRLPSVEFAPALQRGRVHRKGHRWFDADPMEGPVAKLAEALPSATLTCGPETVMVGGGIWTVIYPERREP
jgi:hypothetical protein